jgi:ketol-acid reductoisomerase
LESIFDRLGAVRRSSLPPQHAIAPTVVVADDPPLQTCFAAFVALMVPDGERATRIIKETRFTNKLLGDYAIVLEYHARRLTSGASGYRDNARLCRIVKHGDKSMRKAMEYIRIGEFANASRYEADFLARVA